MKSTQELEHQIRQSRDPALLAEDALTPEQREQVQAILGGVEQTRTYLGRIRAEVQTPLKYKTKKNDKTCRIVEN